jgi:6-pyruvoyltetrahydropterin/6-carboxytetrahydropterin synthase
MYSVTKEVKWDSAHRLYNYEGPCANIHGHSYKALITFRIGVLDEKGFVIDFTEIKNNIQKWIDDNWDHACIVSDGDKSLIEFLKKEKMKYFEIPVNATAEMMVQELARVARNVKFSRPVTVINIKVYETATSYAEIGKTVEI